LENEILRQSHLDAARELQKAKAKLMNRMWYDFSVI
jgi:hypothetical protein